jgi:AAA domain-containing protein
MNRSEFASDWSSDTESAKAADPTKIILPEDAATEISKQIITPPDVIKGVLHRGGKAALGGGTKTYKTWNFIDISVAVATGSVCLDNRETVQGPVLYANFEIPRPFFWKRVQTVCDARQLTLEPHMFEIHHLRGRLRDWPLIENQIPRDKYSLIVLDPSYKLLLLQSEWLREENSSGVVSTLVDRFEQLSARSGAAILFGAHFSKGDQSKKESIDRISGSGVWTRDADSVITFTALETPDCYAVEMTLRNHPRVKKFAMRWDFPLFVPDISLDPTQLKQRKGAAVPQYQPEQLLEVLTEPMFDNQWEAAAIDNFKMSESTFKRLKWKLVAMDAVVRPDRKWVKNEKEKPTKE